MAAKFAQLVKQIWIQDNGYQQGKLVKFQTIIADPPWNFSDSLTMSKVKRGAKANYKTLKNSDIISLPIKDIAAKNSILALWVPSSLLQEGLDTMKSWGFTQKQTVIWVKTKKKADKIVDCLSFGMGRLFRNCHEICLIGTRGSPYKNLKNKSQRTVHFASNLKHSQKPEALQDMLELMFRGKNKLELFARRERAGWFCYGNECPNSMGQDIRESLKILAEL